MTKATSIKDFHSKTKSVKVHNPEDRNDIFLREDGSPVTIEIVGPFSAEFLKANIECQRQKLKLEVEQIGDPEVTENINLEFLSKLIVGWNAPEFFGEYSKDAALALLMDRKTSWIAYQVDAAFNKFDFFKG